MSKRDCKSVQNQGIQKLYDCFRIWTLPTEMNNRLNPLIFGIKQAFLYSGVYMFFLFLFISLNFPYLHDVFIHLLKRCIFHRICLRILHPFSGLRQINWPSYFISNKSYIFYYSTGEKKNNNVHFKSPESSLNNMFGIIWPTICFFNKKNWAFSDATEFRRYWNAWKKNILGKVK